MFNQNWHVVYGPVEEATSVSPDTQVTNVYTLVFRMGGASGEPGPEIVVYTYGEFADVNGQRADGTWPDVIITAMIGYEIREADGDVNDADYDYQSLDENYPGPEGWDEAAPEIVDAAKKLADSYAARGDDGFDWNGESAMMRTGGKV